MIAGELGFAPGDALGDDDGRVVAGIDEQALQQLVDLDTAASFREHAGAAGIRVALGGSVGGNREVVVELELARREQAEHDFGGQNLGCRGRRHAGVGILLEQRSA